MEIKNVEFLQKQLEKSGILEAISKMDLANNPESQKYLAEFLKSVGVDPMEVIPHYKTPEDVEEMKKGIGNVYNAVITTVAA